jgi:hypothetical protein
VNGEGRGGGEGRWNEKYVEHNDFTAHSGGYYITYLHNGRSDVDMSSWSISIELS